MVERSVIEHSAADGSGRGAASRQELPTAAPGLRFAVRFPGTPVGDAGSAVADGGSADTRGAVPAALQHDADEPHPLAGTGKLFFAVAVARLTERDPELPSRTVVVRGEHRAGARSGTLRRMTGELRLTVDDAMALAVGTGDGACVLSVLELLAARGVDVLAEARRAGDGLGLRATTFTGLESSRGGAAGRGRGEVGSGACGEGSGAGGSEDGGAGGAPAGSWGEGLIGTTTPRELCALLVHLTEAAPGATGTRQDASADTHSEHPAPAPTAAAPTAAAGTESGATVRDSARRVDSGLAISPLVPTVAGRVLGWMATTFEPAGLASALPGFGPRTISHRTVSGLELIDPPGAPGWASVLILPAGVGTGRPATCVAAYHPPAHADGAPVTPREASAALGSLGLAVSQGQTGA